MRYASVRQEITQSPDVSLPEEINSDSSLQDERNKASQQAKDSTHDYFDKSFFKPSVSLPSAKPGKKYRPRAPVVATSEEFKKYFEDLELEKENIEQERLHKKAAREKKKQLKEIQKKESLKKTIKKKKINADKM